MLAKYKESPTFAFDDTENDPMSKSTAFDASRVPMELSTVGHGVARAAPHERCRLTLTGPVE
jgi:hypothetical protein